MPGREGGRVRGWNVPDDYDSFWETCGTCGCRYHPAESECACADNDPEAIREARERAAEEAAEDRKADAAWEERNR
jgi:hypothetical protein